MEIVEGHKALRRSSAAACVALGNFDGVHLGHQALLRGAVEAARESDGHSVVYTFEPHPARILAPAAAPAMITSRERKLELLADASIDVCVIEPFTMELAELAPLEFIDQIVVRSLAARHVTVGYDFSFGKGRSGSVDLLRELAASKGFELQVIEPVTARGEIASSSKIRRCLTEGDVDKARVLLGRDFDVDGDVVLGAQRGRTIGVPTANVATAAEILPAAGIYAGRVKLLDDGAWLDAAISLGTNPTFVDADTLSLEAHILDFDRDIYGRRVRVSFVSRLRGEEKFDDIDALIAQIQRDIEQTRQILREAQ